MSETKQYEGVRAASKSSIEIDFYYQGVRCKERIKREPTPANIKAAANHRGAVLNAIALGTFDYATTFPKSKHLHKFYIVDAEQTTGSFLAPWIDNNRAGYKSSTLADHKRTFHNMIIPALGDIPLSELCETDVLAWVDTLTCGPKRVDNIIGALINALDFALKHTSLEVNPLSDWKNNMPDVYKPDHVDPFNQDEQERILSAATGQDRNFIKFAFWSGLRTSELVALNWNDIDFTKGLIRVDKAKTKAAAKPEPPKTKASIRYVKLLPPAREALLAQKKLTSDLIFTDEEGGYLTAIGIRNDIWIPILKKAGVKYRKPSQTRHTYASMMVSAGEPLAWVSQQMGHKYVSTTEKRYARWIPDSDPLAGSRAVKMFS
jgi:integrase